MKQILLKRLLIISGFLLLSTHLLFAGDGTSCATPKAAVVGSNSGNGNSDQYFSYTATANGYLKLTSSAWFYLDVYKTDCSSAPEVSGSVNYNPFYVPVSNGDVVILNINSLYSQSFNLNFSSTVPKEFSNFTVNNGSDYFYTEIDTVANTLIVKVPLDIDLSSLTTTFETYASYVTPVFLNGNQIFSGNNIDFTSVTHVQIKDPELNVETYSITFNKVAGLSCESALDISEGMVDGNGEYLQCYKYTATANTYLELQPQGEYTSFRIKTSVDACSSPVIDNNYYSNNNPLYLSIETGKVYNFKTNSLFDDSFVLSTFNMLPKEITSFSFSIDYNVYNGIIDTVLNTISVKVPSDYNLTVADYTISTSAQSLIQLSVGGNDIPNSGTDDFTAVSSLLLTDPDGKTASYSLLITKIDGISCGTSKTISLGETVGIGEEIQYFNYTPTTSVYLELYPTSGGNGINAYSGDCGSLVYLESSYVYKDKPLVVKCNAGEKITISVNGLMSKKLYLGESASLIKEFYSFQFRSDNFWIERYDASIDTVNNSLVVSVPTDYDLSSCDINLSLTGGTHTKATVNGIDLNNYGTNDLTGVTEIKIVGDDGLEEVYSLTVNRQDGISCSTAKVAYEGVTVGNNANLQFFKYTATKDGILNISYRNPSETFDINVWSGACEALTSLASHWGDGFSPLQVKVENGITYTISARFLLGTELLIEYGSEINKGFNYFDIEFNNSYYSGTIDDNLNIIEFVLPVNMDITHARTSFYLISANLVDVTNNGLPLVSYYDYMNLEEINNIVLTDVNGGTKSYTVVVKRSVGASCEDSKKITLGSTKGNGGEDQFFNFTPLVDGYYSVQMKTNEDNYVRVSMDGCSNNRTNVTEGWNQVVFEGKTGVKYTLDCYSLYDNEISVSLVSDITKEFIYFGIGIDNFSYIDAQIDTVLNTIALSVPASFDLTNSVCHFNLASNELTSVISGGKVVIPGSPIDLTAVHSLIIRDVDNKEVTYTIIVDKDADTRFEYFALPGQLSSSVDLTSKSIHVVMPVGANLSSLIAHFVLPYGASTKVGSVTQISQVSPNDFSTPVVYVNKSADNLSVQNWTINVTIDNATSLVGHNSKSMEVNVFPNPSSDVFNIDLSSLDGEFATIELFNTSGVKIFTNVVNGYKVEINLNDQPNGVYFLKVTTDNAFGTVKLIKR